MDEVVVLFSGGKDSFLTTLLMLDEGYKVYLVTYDNNFELECENVVETARRIQEKYGKDKVEIVGILKTVSIFRELIRPVYNYDLDYIKKQFGNITISQFNCLACRLSMYILTIIMCRRMNINKVVDGARKSQKFVIEQERLLDRFKLLFQRYNIDISFPVLDIVSDYELKNLILAHGFVPKTKEAQCLLGMPIENNYIDDTVIEGCINIFNDELFPKVENIIKTYQKIDFKGRYF